MRVDFGLNPGVLATRMQRLLDVKGDGVSMDELMKLSTTKAAQPADTARLQEYFAAQDGDGDGRLSLMESRPTDLFAPELMKAMLDELGADDVSPRLAYGGGATADERGMNLARHMFDADGDDKISRDDLRALIDRGDARAKALYEAWNEADKRAAEEKAKADAKVWNTLDQVIDASQRADLKA